MTVDCPPSLPPGLADADQLRIVFIFDTWHPDLSDLEREGVAALVAAESPAGGAGL